MQGGRAGVFQTAGCGRASWPVKSGVSGDIQVVQAAGECRCQMGEEAGDVGRVSSGDFGGRTEKLQLNSADRNQ